MESFAQVVEVAHGEGYARLQQAQKLLGLLQALFDEGFVAGKRHLVSLLQTHLTDTESRKHFADALKADFMLVVVGVNHGLSFRAQNYLFRLN